MSKQYSRSAFCGCGAEFQARDRWQRSCPACLEARAAAEAAKPPQACRRCGRTDDVHHKLCPTCRADKERTEAAQTARFAARAMARFGPCPVHPDEAATHDGRCFKCHCQAQNAARRARRTPEAVKPDERSEAMGETFARLPEDRQWEVLGMVLGMLIKVITTPRPAAAEDDAIVINPEQVAHPDQAAIDAAFHDLMGSVNWGEA